jgi:hypothetical protein
MVPIAFSKIKGYTERDRKVKMMPTSNGGDSQIDGWTQLTQTNTNYAGIWALNR